jgi:hypothetical protein
VLIGGCAHQLTVRGDDGARHDVVAREAVPASQPAHPATERQPADPGVRHVPGCGGQRKPLRSAVQRSEHRPALHPGPQRDRIDRDPVHAGEVDHQPAVRHGETGDIVAPATHADLEIALTSGADRGDDIVDRSAPDDQRGAVVDHPVPDRTGGVIAGLAWGEDVTVEARTANDTGGGLLGSGHGEQIPSNRSR